MTVIAVEEFMSGILAVGYPGFVTVVGGTAISIMTTGEMSPRTSPAAPAMRWLMLNGWASAVDDRDGVKSWTRPISR
jgi:hypothetical protein